MRGRLGIIPCTKEKIWDLHPEIGPVFADCAYIGAEFILAKRYIAYHADRVIIFSAKYGFLDLWEIIPETYDVTFARENDPYIGLEELKNQAVSKDLLNFKYVTVICNKYYQQRLFSIFSDPLVEFRCPVENLYSGKEICQKINYLLLEKY